MNIKRTITNAYDRRMLCSVEDGEVFKVDAFSGDEYYLRVSNDLVFELGKNKLFTLQELYLSDEEGIEVTVIPNFVTVYEQE